MQGIGLSCIHISNHIQRQRIKIEIKRMEKKVNGQYINGYRFSYFYCLVCL